MTIGRTISNISRVWGRQNQRYPTLADHPVVVSWHSSIFEPRDSGMAIGGPAPRALPPLPLKLDGGRLVVAGTFMTPPGFGR